MASLLYRLGRTAFRRWPLFLAGWLVVIVAVGGVAGAFGKPMVDAFSIPGIPSEKASDLQAELFPDAARADAPSGNVVISVPADDAQGKLTDEKYSALVDQVVEDLKAAPQMGENAEAVVSPVRQLEGAIAQSIEAGADEETATAQAKAGLEQGAILSDDERTGTVGFVFDQEAVTDIEVTTQEAVLDLVDDARDAGLVAEVNGQAMQLTEIGITSELIGIAIALLVLVLTFGALVAAGLPILIAVVGVGITSAGITAMTAFTDIGSSTPLLATMLGLAVGIDYTLFILARYRDELRHTKTREDAVGVALGTAGSAVVFAGLTVMIALGALAVVRIPFLTTMGLAAASAVVVAVLASLTLLPAILGMLKNKAFAGRVRTYVPATETGADGKKHVVNNSVRWGRLVGKAPLAAVLLVTVALGALAIPVKDMHLAFPTDSTAASDTTQRKASDLLTDAFGPGQEATFLFVVDGRELAEEERAAAYAEVTEWVGGFDGVKHALQAAGTNPDGSTMEGAMVVAVPTTGPQDAATEDLLHDLRDGQSGIEEATGAEMGITGLTAITADVSERLADALPIYLAVVVGLAFILLMLVFRSILVPLTATVGFLLSVMATLGATVAIFQEGWFGVMEGQPIVAFIPIFLIGLVFGLAMDYQVFLVTRMREAHVHGASPTESVIDGFRNSGRVVAAAATIMIAVFAAFIAQDNAIIKSMGFALAVAVAFDAFVIRMTFIPGLMYLMGEKAWWLPKWLDKILPNVDVEGESLERNHVVEHENTFDTDAGGSTDETGEPVKV
ncbi:MMPL family transporter [Nocardioides gilvus]|uniref:MMPL family transporter n=1 Tax=Nocardioides gilvus TaxID=1735589 RepID=UPI000D74E5B2|nr:MMPL family transporter [Nocardioides gilvus]